MSTENKTENKKVVTRFAPSPTGHLHIGGARTAIFSWLLARHFGGEFLLRIEDTDIERSKQEYTDSILASMKWLGLDWDRDLIYQTQRADRYNEIIEEMLANGTAYYCTCSVEEVEKMREEAEAKGLKPKYNGKCRHLNKSASPDAVVRLKLPEHGKVIFDDMVKGKIATDIQELDDMILRRPAQAGGMPTYNLAVVADDHDMGVTHVMRGDDHVANTPKQILIYQAMGWELPTFGHVPMILGADGQKLSKRNGARAVIEYQQDGLLPQALVNYLVRLGWSSGDEEIFTLQELIKLFDGKNLNSSPSRIDPAKIDWLNGHYIKQSTQEELKEHIKTLHSILKTEIPNKVEELLPLFKEKSANIVDLSNQIKTFSEKILESSALDYEEKALKSINDESKILLQKISEEFKEAKTFSSEELDKIIHDFVEKNNLKFKNIGPALRCALTGQSSGSSLAAIASILGKEKVLERINTILNK